MHGGDSLTFLEMIYAPALARTSGYLLVWTDAGKRSAWFRDIEQAAEYALRCTGNTYVGVGLASASYGPTHRALASQIVAVPAIWLDVDFKHPVAHQHDDLPPDEAGAQLLIADVGAEPSCVVHTGHGLQAWWLIDDGDCPTDEARIHVSGVVKAWQQEQIKQARLRRGWRIDATHDLARLMRLPGTWNMKSDPVPVTFASFFSPEDRYSDATDHDSDAAG